MIFFVSQLITCVVAVTPAGGEGNKTVRLAERFPRQAPLKRQQATMRRLGGKFNGNRKPLLVTMLLACSAVGFLFSARADETTEDAATYDSQGGEQSDDPVARNGKIFEDWPQPQLALLFSGEMNGYLEPCGCAGLDNQLGGLKRRHTLARQLEARGWPVAAFDMGGQVRRIGPQAEVKYRYALESLINLGYDAIGFGARELRLSSDALLYVLANLDPETSPLVTANVGLFGAECPSSRKYKVIEAGGKRIGVTSVLGRLHAEILKNNEYVSWVDPGEALRSLMPALESEQCDLLVLMVHARSRRSDRVGSTVSAVSAGRYHRRRRSTPPIGPVRSKVPRPS